MAEFRMPSLGADMERGTLIEWLVKPGDRVHRGDVVAVVETDKGAIEIEVWEDAVIGELLVAPDTDVAVGTPLARLSALVGDDVGPGAQAATAAPPKSAVGPPAVAPAPAPRQAATPTPRAAPIDAAAGAQRGPVARRRISPAARQRARELGVDLDRVAGTGDGGVVTLADVERTTTAQVAAAPSAMPVAAIPSGDERAARVPDPMRRAIAAAMSRSKREIPHYYLSHTIDLEPALQWLERRNAARPIEQRVVYGALLLKAVARAVGEAPAVNGYWRDGAFDAHDAVNLGVVISLRGGGLAAPALQDAAALDLDTLMAALKDATERARRGRLRSSELTAATITVSSLGDTGVESILPIIHPPQVAIVGFGAVMTRPWVVDGGIFVRRVVSATLGADHRASDGHDGARFLAALARQLAKPEAL